MKTPKVIILLEYSDGGFTSFFAKHPNIVAEGNSANEAVIRLKKIYKSINKEHVLMKQ